MSTQANSSHKHTTGHAVPLGVLIGTWLCLVGLTVVTVAAARVDLGELNIYVALGIASLKAAIVALIFMHLKYSGRFKAVVFVVSIAFAAIMIGFITFDTMEYQQDIVDHQKAKAAQQKAAAEPL